MLTFSNIGYFGRLGNQMFQYAALIGVAKKLKLSYGIPYKNTTEKQIGSHRYGFQLFDIFDINCEDADVMFDNKYVYENTSYSDAIFKISDNTDIHGYFQSEKYFEHCRDEIKKQFQFKNKLKYNQIKNNLNNNCFNIGIHVRKDDYNFLHNVYPACSIDYYIKALNISKSDDIPNRLHVFSDDVVWCRSIFSKVFKQYELIYSDNLDYESDLIGMTLCDAMIMANSSFSWWGSWLGRDKCVVAPKQWYSNQTGFDWADIYCASWNII